MKKNVYFVQADITVDVKGKSAYLPYTAGVLVASAFDSQIVKEKCRFKEFIFYRESINDVLSRLDTPSFMGFSCYSWNTEYNKTLAKAVKEKFPQCLVVFGGHDVPDDFDMLEENDFIDVLCHGEGEETIRNLLEAYAQNKSFEDVANISFRTPSGEYIRTATVAQTRLDYPSPYLEGWFDDIIRNYPDTSFNAILETSRGCNYRCAYCDWADAKTKVRFAPFDRLVKEIKWMSDHKIVFLWGTDANFGVNDRDLEIVDEIVRIKNETGYPERMRCNYAKNNFENVFAIVKKLKDCNLDRIGATLSFQSLTPEVLKNIGRANESFDFYKELLAAYHKENMRCYSELILGMPGETYESFAKGIATLFEIGQHYVFETYPCIVLPNARMHEKSYMEKHGIKTVRQEMLRDHASVDSFDIPEYNNIIIETNTMSREMWIRTVVFSAIAKMMHGNGFIRAFAIYLHYEMGIGYDKFYDEVLNYLEENKNLYVSELYFEIKNKTEDISLGKKNKKLVFSPSGDINWTDCEYMSLDALAHFDLFFEEMSPFLKSFGIPEDIYEDLMLYQKAILRRPCDRQHTIQLKYDLHNYFEKIYVNDYQPLEKREHKLQLTDTQVHDNWPDFGRFVVWYGKMGWSSYKDEIREITE